MSTWSFRKNNNDASRESHQAGWGVRELRLEDLPLSPGQTVEIIVLPIDDEFGDLTRLAESGLTFWDNPIDDEVWNDAVPPA